MSPLPYPVKYKKPLTYLSLEDWNNFVANLLWINQYGSVKWLQYYQNGSFKNLNEVFAKTLSVSQLLVNGYKALHNLSAPEAYTFPLFFETMIKTKQVLQAWQDLINKLGTVSFKYPTAPELPLYLAEVLGVEKFKFLEQLPELLVKVYQMVPKIASKIVSANDFAGTQFNFSGSATLEQLIEDYLDPRYLSVTREAIIENLGSYPVLVNGVLYLMPKNCMKVTVSDFSQLQFQAQSPTLLTLGVSLLARPVTVYAITITNNQSDPTPSPFQQLLNLNLSSFISSASQLLNLQFCLDINCNTPLYAWVESYNSDLSQVYIWVLLPNGIPANSSITIYVYLRSTVQYPYTGISPYVAQQLNLSPTEYDNGSNVFTNYWSWAGLSSLPSGWTTVYNSGSSSYSFQTYYTEITNSNTNNGITQSSSQNYENLAVDFLMTIPSFSGTSDSVIGIGLGQANATSTYFIGGGGGLIAGGNSDGVEFGYPNTGATNELYPYVGTTEFSGFSIQNTFSVFSIYLMSSGTIFLYNYSVVESTSDTPGTFDLPITVAKQSEPSDMYLYVIRTRQIPPNGVMPSNSQIQTVVIYE